MSQGLTEGNCTECWRGSFSSLAGEKRAGGKQLYEYTNCVANLKPPPTFTTMQFSP